MVKHLSNDLNVSDSFESSGVFMCIVTICRLYLPIPPMSGGHWERDSS